MLKLWYDVTRQVSFTKSPQVTVQEGPLVTCYDKSGKRQRVKACYRTNNNNAINGINLLTMGVNLFHNHQMLCLDYTVLHYFSLSQQVNGTKVCDLTSIVKNKTK